MLSGEVISKAHDSRRASGELARTDGMCVDQHVGFLRLSEAHDVRSEVTILMVIAVVRFEYREDVRRHVQQPQRRLLEQVDAGIRLVAARDRLQQNLEEPFVCTGRSRSHLGKHPRGKTSL